MNPNYGILMLKIDIHRAQEGEDVLVIKSGTLRLGIKDVITAIDWDTFQKIARNVSGPWSATCAAFKNTPLNIVTNPNV